MKKTKQFIALLSATTMVLSSTGMVFADTQTSTSSTGNSIIEHDGSEAPSYSTIVLPTIATNTYDFKLDPQKLLHEFNSTDYPTAETMYFHSEIAAASIAIDATYLQSNAGSKLYTKSTVESTTTVLKSALTAAASSITVINGNFYVWVPDTASQTNGGKFELLTTSNIEDYFDIDIDDADGSTINSVTAKADHLSEDVVVFDGKVYTDSYAEATNPTSVDGLYVSADQTTYTKIDDSNKDTILDTSAAKDGYTDISDKATIENKATVETTVTATVTVTNTDGLNFVASDTFTGDTDASVYLAITDGSTTTPVEVQDDGTVVATQDFTLAAASSSSGNIKYQTSATDANTGGHVYAQYEASDVTYTSSSFWLVGAANDEAGAKDAWDEYTANLTSTTRPQVEVVYSITNEILDPAPTVTDDYVLVDNGDGTVSYTFVNAPTGSLTAATIDGSIRQGQVDQGNISYSNNKLTFNATAITAVGLDKPGTHNITVTIGSSDYNLTYNVDDFIMTLSADGTITYTFIKVPSGTLTKAIIDEADRQGQVDAGNISYSNSILEFNETAITKAGLDVTGAHTIVVTIGGQDYTLTYTK